MSQKRRFTPEPVTKPATRRAKGPMVRSSSPVPKSKRERAEAPTLPPPGKTKEERKVRVSDETADARPSGMRSRRATRSSTPAATVDEVVADLSKDPRRERDEDD
jgi:hypothetical protein